MPYVVSSLSCNQVYADYSKPEPRGQVSSPATIVRKVLIKGGANVQGSITTPEGVITEITESEAEFLQGHVSFKGHEEKKFVKIMHREANPDKVAANELRVDDGEFDEAGERISGGSAPLSEARGDFTEGGRAAGSAPADTDVVI